MRILAVDDKATPRRALVRAIREAAPQAEVSSCASADEALSLPNIASFNVAFVDIDLPGTNGIELARRLKELQPLINIVFATGYDEYMADAFALRSSGYLMKPITAADVAQELENLRFPTQQMLANGNRLYMRCFGNFEVFANGRAVPFRRAKSKELLAFLVDRRGAVVSLKEIEAALWEEKPAGSQVSSSYLRTLVADLKQSLTECGYGDTLVRRRGELGLDVTKFECDFYDYLRGNPAAISLWCGEYMSQYTWAETTKAALLWH